MLHIINRQKELVFLEDVAKEKKAQLIIIYGRRRVGKTFLIKNFLEEKKAIYYLCSKGNEREQIRLLSGIIGEELEDTALKINPFEDWHSLFLYLTEKAKNERIFLALDEFPYLIDANKAFPSILQKYWDDYLSKTKIFLILCGSSIGMMERETIDYRSPLYGRRTGQWKLLPLKFSQAAKFFEKDGERVVNFYAITGGVPFYLTELDLNKTPKENYLERIAKKGKPFYEEGNILLKEELAEASTYFSIMEAMAKGRTRQGEIASYIGMQGSFITRYLKKLIDLGFIKREIPVTEQKTSKKVLYEIADNFMNFWFTFIYPYASYIEKEDLEKLGEIFDRGFPSYIGRSFEGISKELLIELNERAALPFRFSKLGKWWSRGEEIDIVSLDDETKCILFCEVKWKELSKNQSLKVLQELKDKARLVEWQNEERKEHYGIIAKKIKGKETLRREGYLAYDLGDFEMLRPGTGGFQV